VATARDAVGVAPIPARTLEIFMTCLEREFLVHGETSARVSSLVASGRGESREGRPVIRRLLRRMRAGRENILGLLDFASRASASFACPSEGVPEQCDLLGALARWDHGERAHLRVEADCLVPRALELACDARPVAASIHQLQLLFPSGVRRQAIVHCPAERRSVDLDWCRGCPLVRRIDRASVVCAPDRDAPVDETSGRLGEDASVGEVMGANQVSASPDVPAGELADAMAKVPGNAALLVDDAQRPLGLVEPGEAASSPTGERSGTLGRAGPAVAESESLADAVAFMAKAHRRFLTVIRDDHRALGVLTDLDALRWVAAQRRPR